MERLTLFLSIGVRPSMPPDGLVQNDVLNFPVRAKSKGNANTDIIKTGREFFAEDMVNEAKKFIWFMARYVTRQTERQKVADTFADIFKVLDYCDKNSVTLPRFVIYEPDEVSTIVGEKSYANPKGKRFMPRIQEFCVYS